MGHLNAVAADCEAKTDIVGQVRSRIVFEARLRSIEVGDSSQWLVPQLKSLEEQINQIVVEHVLEAQRLLGPARFQTVNDYVRSLFAQHCFITPCGTKF
jgi:hypothetical protein